ncbi:GNAT family N-acetyltransferase [Roseateles koreensis]|uniref:GNAT family N-acetyltransferase n=1 Tax=Roseateles koreensis TaxID=2987526 RepID=A0ABT5KVR5_9BURK|nr:GNAT family N-acetyltransferase [Roseateles koreensis]MDC8787037.1 GNAT family N-acetyltransferase [Roseateles koreensis]
MLVLKTERLRLRWFVPEDAPHVLAQLTEPSWIVNIRDSGVRDLPAARAWMEEKLFAGYWSSGLGLWAVERASDGVLLGMCGLLQRDYLPAPDIGYAFLPRYWGQGYAREAAAACMAYAQNVLGQTRLYATTAVDNTPSQNVLLSIGFLYQEDLLLDGHDGVTRMFSWGGRSTERSDESQIKDMLQRFYRAFDNRDGRVPNVTALPFWMLGRAVIHFGDERGDLAGLDLPTFMRQRAELLGPQGAWREYEESVSTKRLELQGRVAHVWLRCRKSWLDQGHVQHREGVKSIQLVKQGSHWKIAALAWEDRL